MVTVDDLKKAGNFMVFEAHPKLGDNKLVLLHKNYEFEVYGETVLISGGYFGNKKYKIDNTDEVLSSLANGDKRTTIKLIGNTVSVTLTNHHIVLP